MKRTSRKPSKLSESLQRHLNAYAMAATAAGVGMLALAQPSEAKIIYTETNVKIGYKSEVVLDLTNDGTTDFLFNNDTFSGNGRQSSYLNVGGKKGYSMVQEFRGGYKRAAALIAGKSIGPHQQFIDGGLMADDCIGCSEGSHFGPWANDGNGVKDRYLGLKFKISGQTHYAWAKLTVKVDYPYGLNIVGLLTGYAYETIPNKPIITGKMKGPDVVTLEPGSLGRLAQGSAGRLGK